MNNHHLTDLYSATKTAKEVYPRSVLYFGHISKNDMHILKSNFDIYCESVRTKGKTYRIRYKKRKENHNDIKSK